MTPPGLQAAVPGVALGRQPGVVVEWSSRGFGFVQFVDGRRAYVHHSAIGGGNLEQGEHVTAIVVEDNQNPGKWAALDVQRVLSIPQFLHQVVSQPMQVGAVSLQHGGAVRQDGVVSEWNERGYGFIIFTDGRRAYVHHSSVCNAGAGEKVDMRQGEVVDAVVIGDAQNSGKWAAVDVRRKGAAALQFGPAAGPFAQPARSAGPAPVAPAVGGDRMEGIVKEWNPRGFGFVLFPDGRRAYVHHSFMGGGNLAEGECVFATLVEDVKNPGKWAAMDVVRKEALAPQPLTAGPLAVPTGPILPAGPILPMAQPDARAGERLEGVVTEWSERGYGFLQVSDGRRAYVHVSAFGTGDLAPGEVVNVIVVEDPQSPGKWQARALQRGPLGEDGIVVEWRREGGFGFVAMEDGRRVYIHHSVFGGGDLRVGTRLRVQTRPDGRNPGKWSVASVKTEVHDPAEADEGVGFQRPCGAVVLDWDPRGYGFVQTDDGRRVYVHHSSFGSGNLNVGERVSVVIIPDQRNPGKLMAQTLARDGGLVAQGCAPGSPEPRLDPAAPFSLPAPRDAGAEEWQSGTVVEWHEERGYGFIELADGRRLYVHHSAFGGGSLLQFQSCEAMVAPDKVNAGKWSATAVRGEAVVQRTAGEPAPKRQRAN